MTFEPDFLSIYFPNALKLPFSCVACKQEEYNSPVFYCHSVKQNGCKQKWVKLFLITIECTLFSEWLLTVSLFLQFWMNFVHVSLSVGGRLLKLNLGICVFSYIECINGLHLIFKLLIQLLFIVLMWNNNNNKMISQCNLNSFQRILDSYFSSHLLGHFKDFYMAPLYVLFLASVNLQVKEFTWEPESPWSWGEESSSDYESFE